MPSVSAKQHRTMEMAEHNPAQAAKYGIHIPKKVAHEFNQADIGRYASGGLVDDMDLASIHRAGRQEPRPIATKPAFMRRRYG